MEDKYDGCRNVENYELKSILNGRGSRSDRLSLEEERVNSAQKVMETYRRPQRERSGWARWLTPRTLPTPRSRGRPHLQDGCAERTNGKRLVGGQR